MAALGLGGCGLLGASRSPATHGISTPALTVGDAATTITSVTSSPGASPGASPRAPRAPRRPARPRASAPRGWRTPGQAVRVFAATYVNWTAATVAPRLRALAAVSVGQARAAMLTEAREVAGDGELHRGEVANAGVVEAVAGVLGRPDVYAVVTRERTSAARDAAYRGLPPEWHVSVATVRRMRDGLWELSGWQPES